MLQAHTHNHQSNPKALNPKQELAGRIAKYINHCRIVSEKSNSKLYHSFDRLNSMDMLSRHLLPMVKHADSFSYKDICSFTLISKTYLQNIIPIVANDSHQSSSENIEQIFNDCSNYLQTLKS